MDLAHKIELCLADGAFEYSIPVDKFEAEPVRTRDVI